MDGFSLCPRCKRQPLFIRISKSFLELSSGWGSVLVVCPTHPLTLYLYHRFEFLAFFSSFTGRFLSKRTRCYATMTKLEFPSRFVRLLQEWLFPREYFDFRDLLHVEISKWDEKQLFETYFHLSFLLMIMRIKFSEIGSDAKLTWHYSVMPSQWETSF